MEPLTLGIGLAGLLIGVGASLAIFRAVFNGLYSADLEQVGTEDDPTLKVLKQQFQQEVNDARQAEADLDAELEHELQLEEEDLLAEITDRQAQVDLMEERVQSREILQKDSFQEFKARERDFHQRRKDLRAMRHDMVTRLEEQAGVDREQLRTTIVNTHRDQLDEELAQEIRDTVQEIDAGQATHGRETIYSIIPRMPRHKYTLSGAVPLALPRKPAQKLVQAENGRIVGLVETLLGVRISSFENGRHLNIQGQDLVQSEIAKLTLIGLIEEKKVDRDIVLSIHEEATAYFDKQLTEEGRKAADIIRVKGVHPQLLYYVGKLLYRTSFGQNALGHTIEVAMMAGAIASELGLDAQLARRAGLLHDVGKSINVELEKSHVEVGQDLTRQFNEPDAVINAVAYHHFEEEPRSLEAVCVQIGDAISASRPGARYETKDNYFERIDGLRAVLDSFREVERGYVASAGREIRAHVNPNKIKDEDMPEIAKKVAAKISEDVTFPGTVAVNIVREFNAVEYAK